MWPVVADYFFTIAHSALILFNVFGWVKARFRTAHLVCISLTWFSWVIAGFWYGFGYCVLTDLHWKVLKTRGFDDLPSSYIVFLVNRLTGYSPPAGLTDLLTGVIAFLALVIAVYFNFFSKKNKV